MKKNKKSKKVFLFKIILSVLSLCLILSYILSFNFSYASSSKRTALENVTKTTSYYKDNIGWINDKSTLEEGLKYFYKETGVQPYILFVEYSEEFWEEEDTLDEDVACTYLEEVYEDTFEDEGHFIFAYFECKNDSQNELNGTFLYLSGYSVDTIMDNEALSIFWGYFEENYYDLSLSIEEMISNTFEDTAKNIMASTTNIYDVLKVILIIVIVIIIIIAIFKIIKIKITREKEKEEYTKEILDKPLDTFGNSTSNLEEKYK